MNNKYNYKNKFQYFYVEQNLLYSELKQARKLLKKLF